jgi:conjugative relaxase-like TrwC/TraI family protein
MLTISRAVSVTTNEHPAAWDATISAPKSVSLAALVGGDGRIRDAHRESVNEALKELEKYLQARALKKGKDSTPD